LAAWNWPNNRHWPRSKWKTSGPKRREHEEKQRKEEEERSEVQRQENEQSEAERRRRLEQATQNGESSRLFATNIEAFPKFRFEAHLDDIPEKIASIRFFYVRRSQGGETGGCRLTAGHIPAGMELFAAGGSETLLSTASCLE
jgi:hypothetical protein